MTFDVEGLRVIVEFLNGQSAALHDGLRTLNSHFKGFTIALEQKGVLTKAELVAAGKEWDEVAALDRAWETRTRQAHHVIRRLLEGEEIPDDEVARVFAEAQTPLPKDDPEEERS
jgi:hypothetical protein